MAFFVRPPPDSRYRKFWNAWHYWWGRVTLVVALAQFFYGLWMVSSSPIYYIVVGAILICWVLVGLVKVRATSVHCCRMRWRDLIQELPLLA